MRSLRTILPFLVGIGLFAVLAIVNEARDFSLWRNYALSGIALGLPVTLAIWWYDVRIPYYIQSVIVVGLLLHYGGGSVGSPDPYRMGLLGMHGINGAYHVFGWWDNLTHAVGIGAGAMAVAYLLEHYQLRRGLRWHPFAEATVAYLAALAAGVAVELYEYLGKAVFQTIDQGGYTNTMVDLQFNVVGAALGTLLAVTVDRYVSWRRIRKRWQDVPPAPDPMRISAPMAGFIAFTAIPAFASMYLAARFLFQDIEAADELRLYDPTLNFLTGAAVLGLVVGPIVYGLMRFTRRTPA